MEPSAFQVDDAKAKAEQLAQKLDAADDASERAGIETELRDARDHAQALADAQVSAATSVPTPARDGGSGSMRPQASGAGVDIDSDFAHEQPDASPMAGDPGHSDHYESEGHRFDRAAELYQTLPSASESPMPETSAAIERMQENERHAADAGHAPNPERREGEGGSNVRALRDGESITGTIEDRVTVDGQAFDVVRVEHDHGGSERVMVPADRESELGDTITAERDGADIEVTAPYEHGL